jgi:hypothetical protein
LPHCSPECYSALELICHTSCYQIGLKLWLADLLDVDSSTFTCHPLEQVTKFVDTLPTSPNNNTGTGGMHGDYYVTASTLYIDLR